MNTYVVSFVDAGGSSQKFTVKADYFRTDTNFVVFYVKPEDGPAENVGQFNINRTVSVVKAEQEPAKLPLKIASLPNKEWAHPYDNQGPEVQ